ncbi:MAG: chorismate mutase [Candidatus Methanoplasma sp.]|jgi:prephenate dehydratase|nr:chorismate mutase [Candidatus Methanoplasma sp.]
MIRIGYMGIPFSNTEEAAKKLAGIMGWGSFELVPLMSAAGVAESLGSGGSDYGVVAVRNAVAGPVEETRAALSRGSFETVAEASIPIHHCAFVKREGIAIRAVASHVQALMQTGRSLERLYPGAEMIEAEDTAYAAEMLSEGILPEDVAVVCRRDAGERYGLLLAHENIEDDRDNMTSFLLIRPTGRGRGLAHPASGAV